MFSRHHPLRIRLIRVFGLFCGFLVLLTWVTSMLYFFRSEREEHRETLQAQAAMLATQSAAPLVFGDTAVLRETLLAMRYMEHMNWVMVNELTSGPGQAPERRLLAVLGSPPADPASHLERLAAAGGMIDTLTEISLLVPVVHDDEVRGELIVNLDLQAEMMRFLFIIGVSALLNFLFYLAAMFVFRRVIDGLIQPIQALVAVADRVREEGNHAARADSSHDDEIARLGRAMNDMLDTIVVRELDIDRSRNELRALSLQLQDAREAERARIAHEVHDQLGQALTALKFHLVRELAPEQSARLGQQVDEIIGVVRMISWALRPSVLDSLGLAAAIEWLAKDTQQKLGIRIRCEVPDTMIPADDRATDVFRICQELLTNVARHARASSAHVSLREDEKGLHLEVRDDGIGMPDDPLGGHSLGLLGVRERSTRWGGGMSIDSGMERGSCVRVTLPPAATKDQGRTATP